MAATGVDDREAATGAFWLLLAMLERGVTPEKSAPASVELAPETTFLAASGI